MTDFIESFTTRNMLTPWETSCARSWLFIAPIDTERTQAYLDHYMNSPGPDLSPYHYEVWNDPCFGFLTLVEHSHFYSETTAKGDGRDLSHNEMIWTFPAARYRRTKDNILIEKTLVWIQPFYFDSNSFVTFSSREIWGGEKGMADILIAKGSTAQDFHMDVALRGFSTYNPRSQVHAIGGVHIRGGPKLDKHGVPCGLKTKKQKKRDRKKAKEEKARLDQEQEKLSSQAGMMNSITDPLMDEPENADGCEIEEPILPLDKLIKSDRKLLAFLASFQELMHSEWNADNPTHNFFVPEIRINTLKQYRDAFSIEKAAYRAIIESVVGHGTPVDYGYLPADRIDVRFMWSDSFKEQLQMLLNMDEPGKQTPWGHLGEGLRIEDAGIDWNLPAVRLPVSLALYFEADASFDVERVLHTYGQGPHYPHPEKPA